MANPWESYASTETASKPWEKYAPVTTTPKEPANNPLAFTQGQVLKTAAGALGAPVDLARSAINSMAAPPNVAGMEGRRAAYEKAPLIGANPPGGSQSIENIMRSMGLIDKSSEPTSMGGKLAAGAIQGATGLAMMGPSAIRAIPGALREGAQGIGSMLRPSTTKATTAAQGAARTAAEADAAKLGTTANTEATRAQRLQSIATGRAGQLESARARPVNSSGQPVPDLHEQGVAIDTPIKSHLQQVEETRAAAAQPAYAKSTADAKALEAKGARVDTASVEKPLGRLYQLAQKSDIPGFANKIGGMLQSVKATPEAAGPMMYNARGVPLPPGYTARGIPGTAPVTAGPQGKDFETLVLVSRNLHDIAKGGIKAEGFSSTEINAAREAAHELDRQLIKFNPSYGAAKSEYAELSQPLNVLSTKYGRLLKTEGGLLKDQSSVTSKMDLPGMFLSKPEGVAVLRDLIGDKATDTAMENWILEKSRPGTATAAREALRAPGMAPSLNAAPRARAALESKLGVQAKTEKRIESATEGAKEHGALSARATEAKTAIQSQLANADRLLAENSATSKKEAYKILTSSLDRAGRSGILTGDKWKAAHALIDRKQTLDERTALIKKILGVIGVGEVARIGVTGHL